MATEAGPMLMPTKKWPKGCCCCLGCAVCSAVVLAVVIPVGVFVLGPHVAQTILDHTDVALPNLTQAACPDNYTWLFNTAKIQVPGIGPIKLSSTIESYTQEVWTTSCVKDGAVTQGAECGNNATEHKMGYYISPAMTVSPGVNHNNFTVVMNGDMRLISGAWVVPLWYIGEKTRLILKAKDIKVKVMGITFSGLTMRNDLTCTGVLGQHPSISIPKSVCYPNDPKGQAETSPALRANCVSGVHSIAPTTTTPAVSTALATSKAPTRTEETETAPKAAVIIT